jgi:hypothetical protein
MADYSNVRPDRSDTFCATGGAAVTPDDDPIVFTAATPGSALPPNRIPRGLSFGGAGTLKITTHDGSVLTFVENEIAAGIIHPISVKTVWATGTTATNLKIWW